MKKIHRGDVIGVPGRLMDLFAGLCLVFLSLSGLAMYVGLRNSRKRSGRRQLFWTYAISVRRPRRQASTISVTI
jgi:hypothetical protein